MARITQYYLDGGVPLRVDADPAAVARAWRSQRERLRSWLADLPTADWAGPTRCVDWDVTTLAAHLASGAQFLGYTLHQANKGIVTERLRGFDTRTTVAATTAPLATGSPAQVLAALAAADESVERELAAWPADREPPTAEAPPGRLPAHLAVCHFLFDSWVHERDLRLPRGDRPATDPEGGGPTAQYLVGLATLWGADGAGLHLRLTEPSLELSAATADGVLVVARGAGQEGSYEVVGALADVVDRATGRASGPVGGDPEGLAALDRLASLL